MDLFSFVVFSFNTRYIMRWILAGVVLVVPFFSLGYLVRTSDLSMIGGIGLPTWDRKGELWWEGARLVYIVILYEALPSFLFSLSFLLSSPGYFITSLIGHFMKYLALGTFVVCSFFLPFAFCAFVESREASRAFDFERIARAVKKVFVPYTLGYIAYGFCLYLVLKLHRIPYVGLILCSILTFYVLLVATYYFTQLFRKTRRSFGGVS